MLWVSVRIQRHHHHLPLPICILLQLKHIPPVPLEPPSTVGKKTGQYLPATYYSWRNYSPVQGGHSPPDSMSWGLSVNLNSDSKIVGQGSQPSDIFQSEDHCDHVPPIITAIIPVLESWGRVTRPLPNSEVPGIPEPIPAGDF